MNNMYDILARITLLEGKGKPDFLDLDKDGDQEESMKDAAQDVNEQDVAGEYPHRQSKTFGHSHNMAPGYDPTYADPLRMGFKNEIEELEHLLYNAGSNAELNRRTALARKYGLNSPQDMAKLPQLKQQMMRQIGRTQQQLQARSAEANVAARDEDERQLARMQAAAGIQPAANAGAEPQGQATFRGITAPTGIREGTDVEPKKKTHDKKSDSMPRDEYGDPDGVMFDPRSQRDRERDSERHSDRHGRGREFAETSKLDELSPELLSKAGQKADFTGQDLQKQGQGAKAAAYQRQAQNLYKGSYKRDQERQKTGLSSGKRKYAEGDMEEGNDFTGARMAAIRAGKPTFKVDGKIYKVTGDTSDEKVLEREYKDKDEFDQWAEPGDTVRTSTGGKITKTAGGVRHERGVDDEDTGSDDDYDQWGNRKAGAKKTADGEKRGRGRPKKYTDDKPRQERVTAKSRKADRTAWSKKSVKEGDLEEDYDRDEYDEEGEMAKSQLRTIEDAAEELQSILDSDENLPEWAQKKITLAKEYIDSARDYLAANRPEDEPMMAEKAPPGAKAERMVKHIKKGYAKDGKLSDKEKSIAYATAWKAKKAGKVEETDKEDKKEVEETTTSGSVATAPAEAPKGKKGMVFGKGVYESQIAESFDNKLKSVLTESMNVSINASDEGQNSVTVTATDEDAAKLSELLKMAGLFSSGGYSTVDTGGDSCEVCGGHEGMHEAGCSTRDMVEEELANSPDETYADMDTILNKLAGGLNGPKRQINPNNMADNPMAMTKLGKGPASLNLGETMQQVQEETEQRLADLYKNYKG
jgi:hypothetical protein